MNFIASFDMLRGAPIFGEDVRYGDEHRERIYFSV